MNQNFQVLSDLLKASEKGYTANGSLVNVINGHQVIPHYCIDEIISQELTKGTLYYISTPDGSLPGTTVIA